MSQQSEDDPSSTSPLLFSTPPNEIYFGEEKTTPIEEGEEIEKFYSTEEKTISGPSDAKINFVGEPLVEEKPEEGGGSMNKKLESLDQQNSMEDKFKSFSVEDNEEENVGELEEDMNFKEERSKDSKTAKMVYSATFNNTFPSCEGEGSMGKEDMKMKKLSQKPFEGTCVFISRI
uniref:Uncharacterized protein n=1 Tax=Meloidogyne javanica TaxID=6303 RepID=A0A915MLC8_MELJA